MEVEPFPNHMPFGKFLNITASQFPQMSNGNFTIRPHSHFLPCPPSFSDQLFLCCLKTIRKESEMDPGEAQEVILIFRYTVASAWILFHRTLESSDKG